MSTATMSDSSSSSGSSSVAASTLNPVPVSSLTPSAQSTVSAARQLFRTHFGDDSGISIGLAPGRVNLIGEHTDYNGGFVMPLAIDRHAAVVVRKNALQRWRIVSANAPTETSAVAGSASSAAPASATPASSGDVAMDSSDSTSTPAATTTPSSRPTPVEFTPEQLLLPFSQTGRHWHNYIRGVIAQFQAAGHELPCLDVAVASSVPLGGGLSSSAALEVATACALQSLLGLNLDAATRAQWCQKAEHEFAGVPCGIMDQFISSAAKDGHVMMLDCRSLQPTFIEFSDPNVSLLITNSNVKHGHDGGEYAARVRECNEAVKCLQIKWPDIKQLRDASFDQLSAVESLMSEDAFYRARHVIMENDRTKQAIDALRSRDYARLGQLLTFSHVSLKNDFEVSCEELDCLVDIALELPGVAGARMTGGGFGGCTLTLVSSSEASKVEEAIIAEYREQTGIEASCLITRPTHGAVIVQP